MGKAKIVAPPPKDYIPEPLISPPVEINLEETVIQEWSDSNLIEQLDEIIVQEEPVSSEEELEKERIAQEKYEEIQRQKIEAEEQAKRREKLEKKSKKKDTELLAELELLRASNEQLAREKEAAEKAREETILAMRNKATEQRGNQLNLVKQRKPSLWTRFKNLLKRRRMQVATVGIKNYETAILQRARIAVPKMLDDLEKMHEQLTIMEELLAKYTERQKIKDQ
jgi:UTP:GlnB (protein PII) uridylyltransferase